MSVQKLIKLSVVLAFVVSVTLSPLSSSLTYAEWQTLLNTRTGEVQYYNYIGGNQWMNIESGEIKTLWVWGGNQLMNPETGDIYWLWGQKTVPSSSSFASEVVSLGSLFLLTAILSPSSIKPRIDLITPILNNK